MISDFYLTSNKTRGNEKPLKIVCSSESSLFFNTKIYVKRKKGEGRVMV